MQLVITIRREVADQPEAEALYEVVKQRLADRPSLELTGHCTNHFTDEDPE